MILHPRFVLGIPRTAPRALYFLNSYLSRKGLLDRG